jgi:hypothetical protein
MPSTVMPTDSLALMQSPSSSKLSNGVEGPYRVVKYNTGSTSEPGTSAAAAVIISSNSQLSETCALLEIGLENDSGFPWHD